MVEPHQGTAIVVIIQRVWVMCMVAVLLSVKSLAYLGVLVVVVFVVAWLPLKTQMVDSLATIYPFLWGRGPA